MLLFNSDISWRPDIDKWSNIRRFGKVNRSVENLFTGEISSEDLYYIASFNDSIKLFARAIRNHWSAENIHRDLDMYFDDN